MGNQEAEGSQLDIAGDKPLVTFALFAYNQEKYIREAVAGAFAQTYCPLEILLSDDHSADRTFEIMEEMADSYLGPHKIIVNRNERNLGISTHVRRAHEMSCGELIVHAAGDDFSRPDRTQIIVDAYLAQSNKPSLIESNAELIDEAGVYIGLYQQEINTLRKYAGDPVVKRTLGGGCTYAIHRSLIDKFEAPMPGIIAEDGLINIRANMLKGSLFIPDTLVKYRITSAGVWSSMKDARLSPKDIVANETRYTRSRILIARQAISDARKLHAAGITSEKDTEINVACIDKSLSELERWLTLCEAPFASSTLTLFKATYARDYIEFKRWLKIYLMRWLPIGHRLKATVSRLIN